jgi:hypothetical protein
MTMPELDDRVARGLHDLLDRAPSEAEVWTTTERYVQRNRHRRQMLAALVVAAVLAVVGGVALHSTTGSQRVRVATTVPDTTPSTAPSTKPTATSTTMSPPTTVPSAVIDACPGSCLGRTTADVDGDGKPDRVGLIATPPLSGDITAGTPSTLTIRVVFASGGVAEFEDRAEWDASLVGAADINDSGKAMILYFNDTGASHHRGRILQWDGTRLVAVKGPNGEPFTTFIDGYAMGGRGFRCAGDSFMTTTIQNGPADEWTADENVYRWNDDTLVPVAENQPIAVSGPPAGTTGFYVPPEYDQLIGVHCAGLENKRY